MHGQLSICFSLLFIGLVSEICDGATWYGEVSSQDGKCVLDDGSLKDVDETWYDDANCYRYNCEKDDDDGKYYVSGASCPARSIPEGCQLVPRSGHYPRCCPRPVCPST